MKKTALLLIGLVMTVAVINAQTPQTAETLQKALEKSNKDTQNPKKAAKYATWVKRGNIYLEMLQFNTKGLWQGMPQKGLNGAEILVGKPQKIMSLENKEDWIYERVILKFVDGKLDKWEETKPLVENGVNKAYEAYEKAWGIDSKEKGKLKTDDVFLQNISILRGLYSSEGVKYYNEAEKTKEPETYKKAVAELDKALVLDNKYPKLESDTLFNPALVTYYAGVIAQSGKHFELSEKYYNICLEKEYEGAKPYHGLASIYKAQEQKDKELNILKEGFNKYPESNELLVDFINYYLGANESEKALAKLEQGIKENPENQTYYYAIGTLYDSMMQDTTSKYSKEQKAEYEGKAIVAYKKAIELKEDYFNALYNIGALYYNKAAFILKAAQDIPLNQKTKYDAEKEKANVFFKVALPYMEKAHEIEFRDKNTLMSLSTIYLKLEMMDKQKEIKELLDNLPSE